MIPCETILSDDRLALFGLGLFETLLVTDRVPLFADLHWQRMHRGAQILNLRIPDQQEWLQHVREFIKQTPGHPPYALRITLSGGAPLANLPSQLLLYRRVVPYTLAQHTLGIQLHVLAYPRNEYSPLCSLKSTNYLENILAKEEANLQGCEEGLWLNTQGHLAEGTMSNLFFIKNRSLFTPSLASGCLPGTRRQLILELARSLQIPTHEGSYTFTDLLSSDEIFMTNSLMGIMPVRKIREFTFSVSPPGSLNSVMRCLELEYIKLIRGNS